jgi:hypothetical protein
MVVLYSGAGRLSIRRFYLWNQAERKLTAMSRAVLKTAARKQSTSLPGYRRQRPSRKIMRK